MGRYRNSGIQPANNRMGMPNRRLQQKDDDVGENTPPRKKTPARELLRAKQARYNMPVLQQDPQRAEKITNTHSTSATGRELEHWNMPENTQRRYAQREMGQYIA